MANNNQQVQPVEKKSTERVVEYVREKSASINWTPIILAGGAIFLGYEFLKSQGLIKSQPPTSTATTPECPRGVKYTRGLFGDCDPNYVVNPWENFWSGGTCECLSATGGTAVSPQHMQDIQPPYKRHQEYYPGIPPGSHPPLPVGPGLRIKRPISGLPQEGYTHNWPDDREQMSPQLSLSNWTPLTEMEKLKLGIR